jgi:hypothetical protein
MTGTPRSDSEVMMVSGRSCDPPGRAACGELEEFAGPGPADSDNNNTEPQIQLEKSRRPPPPRRRCRCHSWAGKAAAPGLGRAARQS